jgi:hypothetical protein
MSIGVKSAGTDAPDKRTQLHRRAASPTHRRAASSKDVKKKIIIESASSLKWRFLAETLLLSDSETKV